MGAPPKPEGVSEVIFNNVIEWLVWGFVPSDASRVLGPEGVQGEQPPATSARAGVTGRTRRLKALSSFELKSLILAQIERWRHA